MKKIFLLAISFIMVVFSYSVCAQEVKPECRKGNNSELIKTFDNSTGTVGDIEKSKTSRSV